VKAVVFSDAHADHVTYGVRRKPDIERAILAVTAHAIKIKADVVFFLGDLSDPEDGPAVLQALELLMLAAHGLRQERIPFICIPGNHDVIEDGTGRTSLSPMRVLNDGSFYLCEQPEVLRLSKFNVFALPFTASSHGYHPAKFIYESSWSDAPIFVIGHLMIPGVQPGEETKEMTRGREVLFPFDVVADLAKSFRVIVCNGHYHRRQTFRAPGGFDIHIPGSLARLTLGEERHDPGFLVLEV
jgi:DNA repair exonuclease SbcCD nuclease subunit